MTTQEKLEYRYACERDAHQLMAWWNSGDVMAHAGFPNGLGITFESVILQINAYEKAIDSSGLRKSGLLILQANDFPVGEMSFRRILIKDSQSSLEHSSGKTWTYEIGIKICDSSYQGAGRGEIFLKMLLEDLFINYDAEAIILDTNVTNMRAQRLYEKLGFQRETVQPDPWKNQHDVWQESITYRLSLVAWLKKYPLVLSKEHMKHYLIEHHGLGSERPYQGKDGLMAYLKKVGCIQFDPIDLCGKSPELTVHAHVESLSKSDLYDMLYKERVLVDYFDKNLSILPIEDWALLEPFRQHYKERLKPRTEEELRTKEAKEHVLSWIHAHGAVSSKDLNLDEKVDWYWGPTRLSRATLEGLYFEGELIIHHKKGTNKYYALAKDFIPRAYLDAKSPFKTLDEYHDLMVLRRIRAVGALWCKASDAFLGILDFKAAHRNETFKRLVYRGEIFPIHVDGISESLYVTRADWDTLKSRLKAKNQPMVINQERVYFIAPLDAMIWDRKLIAALWGFSYKWEIYTPATERVYSYYVLPMVYEGEFVGRIELAYFKKENRVEVKGQWLETAFQKRLDSKRFKLKFESALKKGLDRLIAFHTL
jgi:uncharacterized protein YcaQ